MLVNSQTSTPQLTSSHLTRRCGTLWRSLSRRLPGLARNACLFTNASVRSSSNRSLLACGTCMKRPMWSTVTSNLRTSFLRRRKAALTIHWKIAHSWLTSRPASSCQPINLTTESVAPKALPSSRLPRWSLSNHMSLVPLTCGPLVSPSTVSSSLNFPLTARTSTNARMLS